MPTTHLNFYLITTFPGRYRIISFMLFTACMWNHKNFAKCSESSGLFPDTGLLPVDLWKCECASLYLSMGSIILHPSPWQSIFSLCRLFSRKSVKHAMAQKKCFLSNTPLLKFIKKQNVFVSFGELAKFPQSSIWRLEVIFPLRKFIYTESKFRDIRKNA